MSLGDYKLYRNYTETNKRGFEGGKCPANELSAMWLRINKQNHVIKKVFVFFILVLSNRQKFVSQLGR